MMPYQFTYLQYTYSEIKVHDTIAVTILKIFGKVLGFYSPVFQTMKQVQDMKFKIIQFWVVSRRRAQTIRVSKLMFTSQELYIFDKLTYWLKASYIKIYDAERL